MASKAAKNSSDCLKIELKGVLDRVAIADTSPRTPPTVIMMVGVNGTGKTTTTGKLAALFRAQQEARPPLRG